MTNRLYIFMNTTMKRLYAIMAAMLLTAATTLAQTLNLTTGNVTYQFPAAETGDMTYSNGGQTLTVMGRAFAMSDITSMVIDNTAVSNNTVAVSYSGTSATVTVSGNVAQYVSATVSGAHVTITPTNTADVDGDEITYQLSGTSTNGSLTLGGSYKCTVALAGVTLTNPSGAAINITNKKRIQVSAKNGTVNTLTDGTSGSWKGCLYSKGQLQLQGKGTLNVAGNTSHAIKCGDYITIKNLTLNVTKAMGDGISCNKYFVMNSGAVTISGVSDDGLQCEFEDDDAITGQTTDHEDENSGNIYIEGGSLNITTTGDATKCIKADSCCIVNDGTITLNVSGGIDLTDTTDPGYCAGISAGKFVQNGGTITVNVSGTAGRGIKATDLITNGGTLTVTNSAAGQQGTSDNYTAKCLKGENIALNGGTITLKATGTGGKGILAGSGTKTTSGMTSRWTNVTGSFTIGSETDGTSPTLTITTTGSRLGSSSSFSRTMTAENIATSDARGGGGFPGGGGGNNPWNPGGESSDNTSSAKGIKSIPAVYIYGGTIAIDTATDGAEGLESKTGIYIGGGQHYLKCYDDCINSAGQIVFDGGATVCYSFGNDAVDSNAGTSGAITIGNGAIMAYSTKGSPEEAFDCDNNSYIRITGTGVGIGIGGAQSGSSGTISGAAQGYAFPGSVSFKANVYNTLADASGNNLVTFQLPAAVSSQCTFITATGMKSGSKYTVKSSTTAPTDATTSWHGLYLGSSHAGTTSVSSFTAK